MDAPGLHCYLPRTKKYVTILFLKVSYYLTVMLSQQIFGVSTSAIWVPWVQCMDQTFVIRFIFSRIENMYIYIKS
jgi:hypothetical protein